MSRLLVCLCFFFTFSSVDLVFAADIVPSDVQMPGTQPLEISNLESPNKCDNCHGGYNSAVEPAHNWSGSMMGQAGRDPIFWATVAIAEQDFDGVGDLCIRCHSTTGWLAGRSTPTDGSGLAASDSDGVDCDYCHKLTNPNDLEFQGVMNSPFIANDGSKGWYGSGMSSMWGGNDKLGPYVDAEARHQFMKSEFHRDPNFCGTCHDVSNPVTGDLAPNHGVLFSTEPVTADGTPGSDVDGKAAFNNAPYSYGVVERTFSEYKSGAISSTEVDDYPSLPEELQGGVLEAIYFSATGNESHSADYENPSTTRYYSCQTCHMRPVTGTGADKRGVPVRRDLPLHDMTGGNYWMARAIDYLNTEGKLRLGGDMTTQQIAAMYDGALRAEEQLMLAATLEVESDEVKIINHTGHKLITGYPEGRRMWLNIKYFDGNGDLSHEIGEYGNIQVMLDGVTKTIRSIVDLDDEELSIYQAKMGMTQDWANALVGLGYPRDLELEYDRITGDAGTHTLGGLADSAAGTKWETFHFALNNTVIDDNRIPPYGMRYDEALRRNASPVPITRYDGESGSVYDHYAEVGLNPPPGAVSATIDLLYQPTSWEYIQFLYLANDGSNSFLGNEGSHMLEAWLNEGMAEPLVMASASWGTTVPEPGCDLDPPTLTGAVAGHSEVSLQWTGPAEGDFTHYALYYDQADKAQKVADTDCTAGDCTNYTDTGLTNEQQYCYKVTAYELDCESAFSNILCAIPQAPGQFNLATAAITETGRWVREGKGKNATQVFETTAGFTPGDEVVIRLHITGESGSAVAGATVSMNVSGPVSAALTSTVSDGAGNAEVRWSTAKPNKKGAGGTPQGNYTATVNDLSSTTHDWDGTANAINFTLGSGTAQSGSMHGKM